MLTYYQFFVVKHALSSFTEMLKTSGLIEDIL